MGQRSSAEVMSLVVERREERADDVYEFWLGTDDGTLPQWEPGDHLELRLPSGTIRHYSLCGESGDAAYRVAVFRDSKGRGGSMEVCDTLKPDMRVDVRGPIKNFRLHAADRYVFVAGGIGITPIVPMIERVDAQGLPWELHYGGRTSRSMAFVDRLLARGRDKVSLMTMDREGPLDIASIVERADGAEIYCCGPQGLIDALTEQCGDKGLTKIHFERFAVSNTGGGDRERKDLEPFKLELRTSGVTVDVLPGETILGVARRYDPSIPYSCGEGICGSCETKVICGRPRHGDAVLTPEEREASATMMICVGWSESATLVLDL